MTLSKTTKDHQEIRKWAESHGAVPAEVASTERRGEPGILRFEFPNAPNRNDSDLKKISWDNFFEKFDENNLELIYQEKTADGQKSNFNKLVHPSSDEHSSHRSAQGGSRGSSPGSGGSAQSGGRSNKSEGDGGQPRRASGSSDSSSHKSGSGTSQSGGSKSSTSMLARDREIEDDLDIEDEIERSSSRGKSSFKSR